ncbi:hypothetical protein LR48_Vigan05g127700 [Vigna angularis]|uniref:Uncharacterized protein n=1 Tax=Phaseolus angularis TaxID=3914 RepID=A0A0L9UM79_PHAAN|nr:hypothetical protein LR48_Vigan05g127700 [Vigna angularis]
MLLVLESGFLIHSVLLSSMFWSMDSFVAITNKDTQNPRSTTQDDVMVIGDVLYIEVELEWVMRLRRMCGGGQGGEVCGCDVDRGFDEQEEWKMEGEKLVVKMQGRRRREREGEKRRKIDSVSEKKNDVAHNR